MRYVLILAAALALLVPAAAGTGVLPGTAPTPTESAPEPSPAAAPETPRTVVDGERSAATALTAPEYVPEPEPAPDPGGYDPNSNPSLDEQIAECTRQTGLPQECEDKIRHGIP